MARRATRQDVLRRETVAYDGRGHRERGGWRCGVWEEAWPLGTEADERSCAVGYGEHKEVHPELKTVSVFAAKLSGAVAVQEGQARTDVAECEVGEVLVGYGGLKGVNWYGGEVGRGNEGNVHPRTLGGLLKKRAEHVGRIEKLSGLGAEIEQCIEKLNIALDGQGVPAEETPGESGNVGSNDRRVSVLMVEDDPEWPSILGAWLGTHRMGAVILPGWSELGESWRYSRGFHLDSDEVFSEPKRFDWLEVQAGLEVPAAQWLESRPQESADESAVPTAYLAPWIYEWPKPEEKVAPFSASWVFTMGCFEHFGLRGLLQPTLPSSVAELRRIMELATQSLEAIRKRIATLREQVAELEKQIRLEIQCEQKRSHVSMVVLAEEAFFVLHTFHPPALAERRSASMRGGCAQAA